ncbi:MAG: DUF1924 domain-containing protein [Gammaproteobacteria bacterium]|nr:DUF1924 domain-containing protein [Gammaproteobacteria bacterium]MDH5800583.1 DUF1924 domain-containing protein [Gammaproteobacteria bacterium]
MVKIFTTITVTALLTAFSSLCGAGALEDAFKQFANGQSLSFDANTGKTFWNKTYPQKDGKVRQCATCHGDDLSKAGKHIKTGKTIEPLAPSVNKERFTKLKKINKWFKRNCKWTVGRECTNQEKGDLLKYLSQL